MNEDKAPEQVNSAAEAQPVTPEVTPQPAAPVAQPVATPVSQPPQEWVNPTNQQPAQVQYVVTQQSLNGISGMLIFWIIVFSLAGLGSIAAFFMTITNPFVNSTAAGICSLIFSPFIASGSLFAVVMIAMRKKLAIWSSIGASGLMFINSAISTIITVTAVNSVTSEFSDSYYFSETASAVSSVATGAAIAAVITSLVYVGLVVLYFLTSKRVKQTLTN